jgi:hypothetical protein
MTDIKTIKLGDFLIDENLFTKFCGLTDAVMSWPSAKENEGGVKYSGDLIWYLFRNLTFEKCKTAEGHSGWVITIDNRGPL